MAPVREDALPAILVPMPIDEEPDPDAALDNEEPRDAVGERWRRATVVAAVAAVALLAGDPVYRSLSPTVEGLPRAPGTHGPVVAPTPLRVADAIAPAAASGPTAGAEIHPVADRAPPTPAAEIGPGPVASAAAARPGETKSGVRRASDKPDPVTEPSVAPAASQASVVPTLAIAASAPVAPARVVQASAARLAVATEPEVVRSAARAAAPSAAATPVAASQPAPPPVVPAALPTPQSLAVAVSPAVVAAPVLPTASLPNETHPAVVSSPARAEDVSDVNAPTVVATLPNVALHPATPAAPAAPAVTPHSALAMASEPLAVPAVTMPEPGAPTPVAAMQPSTAPAPANSETALAVAEFPTTPVTAASLVAPSPPAVPASQPTMAAATVVAAPPVAAPVVTSIPAIAPLPAAAPPAVAAEPALDAKPKVLAALPPAASPPEPSRARRKPEHVAAAGGTKDTLVFASAAVTAHPLPPLTKPDEHDAAQDDPAARMLARLRASGASVDPAVDRLNTLSLLAAQHGKTFSPRSAAVRDVSMRDRVTSPKPELPPSLP